MIRQPILDQLYESYLGSQDQPTFAQGVAGRYFLATLHRLAEQGQRMTRRAAVFALGLLGDYESNAVVGRRLNDQDRGVRTLADTAIRSLWLRDGDSMDRQQLENIVQLNHAHRYEEAIGQASRLIDRTPWIAETWNQRAIAYYSKGRFSEAINDCHQALEVNPYQFGAAAGMGQCYLQLGDRAEALEAFRRALRLNPGLEGVRAQVVYLQRQLRGHDEQPNL